MAKVIDWDKNEEENKSVYKDYAPEGNHTTKIAEVKLQEASTGSKGIRFILADNSEYAFPKYGAVAWVSTKNDSWRIHHMKELFVVLGFTEAQARKAVEQCEDKEDLAGAYLTMFEKALPKAKELEVAVYKVHADDEYSTWDFANEKVRMGRPEKKEEKKEDVFADAVELTTEETTDLPF
jgi:hypothetical protein